MTEASSILSTMIGEHVHVHWQDSVLKGPLIPEQKGNTTIFTVKSGKGGACGFTEKSILSICEKRIVITLKP
jgi:hypothetical protein